MVTIPRFTRSQSIPSQGSGVRADIGVLTAPARAVQRAADRLGFAIERREERRRREEERLQRLADANFANERASRFRRETSAAFEEARLSDDPFDTGFSAQFSTRMEEIKAAVLEGDEGVSDAGRGLAIQRIDAIADRLFDASLRLQGQAMEAKALDEITGGVNDLSAGVAKDPRFFTQALVSVDALVNDFRGALPADTLRDARRLGRQSLVEAQIETLVARRDFAAARRELNDEAFNEDLTPAKRAELTRAIDAGEREATAVALRKIEGQVKEAVFLLDHGREPGEIVGFDALKAQVKGSAFEPVLDAALEDRARMRTFVGRSLEDQREAIQGLAEAGATARNQQLLERFQKIHAATVKGLATDPLGTAAEIGVIGPVTELDFQDPASLAARQGQAAAVAAHYGIPVSPLRKSEAEKLKAVIDDTPADDVPTLFTQLREGFGADGARLVAGQLAADDGAIGLAFELSGQGTGAAAAIVEGVRVIADNTDARPSPTDKRPVIRDELGDTFFGDPQALAPFIEAADAVYAARRARTGDFTAFDADDYRAALRLVAGGRIDALGEVTGGPVEFNGDKLLPPVPGMSGAALEDLMRSLSDVDLELFGNDVPIDAQGRALGADDIREGRLVTVGFGRYAVIFPGLGVVGRANPAPDETIYILDLGALAEARPVATQVLDKRTEAGALTAGELLLLGPTGEVTAEGRRIFRNSQGGVSSELSITVTDELLNEGRPTNIPSIFGGRIVPEREAIDIVVAAGGRDPETGRVLPGFDSIEAAERAAATRSKGLGAAGREP